MSDLELWGKVIQKIGWMDRARWQEVMTSYQSFMTQNQGLQMSVSDYLIEMDILTEAQCQSAINIIDKVKLKQAEKKQGSEVTETPEELPETAQNGPAATEIPPFVEDQASPEVKQVASVTEISVADDLPPLIEDPEDVPEFEPVTELVTESEETQRDFGQPVIAFEADEADAYQPKSIAEKGGHPEAFQDRDYQPSEDDMIDLAEDDDHASIGTHRKSRHPDAVKLSQEVRDEMIEVGDIEQLDLADEDEDPAGVKKKWSYDEAGNFIQNDSVDPDVMVPQKVAEDDVTFEDSEDPLELNLAPDDDRLEGYSGRMSAVDWVDSNETDQNDYERDEDEQIDLE